MSRYYTLFNNGDKPGYATLSVYNGSQCILEDVEDTPAGFIVSGLIVSLITRLGLGVGNHYGYQTFYNIDPAIDDEIGMLDDDDLVELAISVLEEHGYEYSAITIDISSDPWIDNPLDDYDGAVLLTYPAGSRYVLGNYPVESLDDLMAMVNSGNYIALPVYTYIHSGIAMKVGSSWHNAGLPQGHAAFDSGLSGYVMVLKETVREWYGVQRLSKQKYQQAEQELADIVAWFCTYLNGDIWHLQIREGDEVLDFTTLYGTVAVEEEIAVLRQRYPNCRVKWDRE